MPLRHQLDGNVKAEPERTDQQHPEEMGTAGKGGEQTLLRSNLQENIELQGTMWSGFCFSYPAAGNLPREHYKM